MRILSWNIRHGGNESHLSHICDTLVAHNPDVLILTEFREGTKGQRIKQELRDQGWTHQRSSGPAPKTNGILVASKEPIHLLESPVAPTEAHRWMEIEVRGVNILAIHIPVDSKQVKTRFWNSVLERSEGLVSLPSLIIGDFNTGLPRDAEGAPFHCVVSMQQLLDSGWHDAWRGANRDRQDYSWYSHAGNGFRIDHVFVSGPLTSQISQCYYSHGERELGYSDHSALIVELYA